MISYNKKTIIVLGVDAMNWLHEMVKSIDYIEAHLTEPLEVQDIAKAANASSFYYQRMFSVLTNMSVQTYIRNRRMTLAAMELQTTDTKVIDLAFKYQYDSSEAFSRAFKSVHGVSPSKARKDRVPVKAFLKLSIQVSMKGDVPMNYRLETKEGFTFYGMTKNFSIVDDSNLKEIPKWWQDTMVDGSYNKMISHSSNNQCLGVCMPMDIDKDTDFNYVIGAFSQKKVEDFDNYQVPKAEWAVFELRGPMQDTLQLAWKRIFSEWFPQTGYKHANLPEFEVYMDGDMNASDYYMEIWVPITKD